MKLGLTDHERRQYDQRRRLGNCAFAIGMILLVGYAALQVVEAMQ